MKINIKILVYTIILFSFLEPEYFTSTPLLHMIFNLTRILGIVIGFLILLNLRQVLYVTMFVVFFYTIMGISTFISGGDLLGLLSDSILIIGFVMWVEILLKNTPIRALQILNFLLTTLTYFNVLFFILFPNGYESYYSSTGLLVTRYFLGVYNQFAAILIPAVIISVIYSLVKYNRITVGTNVLILTVLFTFTYFWSATSVLGIVLLIFYLIFIHRGLLKYFINYKVLSIVFILLFILIVLVNRLDIFSFIIEGMLDKDLTLSTRTRIWDQAIFMITESPLLGYGYLEGGRYVYITENIQRNAHNMFLQFNLQSGVLGFISVVLLIIIMFKRISRYNNTNIVRFFLFSLFVSFVMMLAEVYSLRFIYLLVLIGAYIPNIIEHKKQ